MQEKRTWWQRIKKHPFATGVVVFLVLILFVFLAYRLGWDWTGFNRPSKTLWDWLQLLGVLAVPVVVGFGAVWFTTRQGKAADAENKDNQREKALQDYIDKMSELLLHEKLRDSVDDDEVRKIARVRTITVLTQLDARRIGYVFAFLRETGLMSTAPNDNIVSLSKADLRKVNWRSANLSEANLSEADLSRSDLRGADLRKANLRKANFNSAKLSNANLYNATLIETDLSNTDLSNVWLSFADLSSAILSSAILSGATLNRATLIGANVNKEQLAKAKSLKGATMPDGSIHL